LGFTPFSLRRRGQGYEVEVPESVLTEIKNNFKKQD
jgi:hypothetical protein